MTIIIRQNKLSFFFFYLFENGKKNNHLTLAIRAGALCAGRLARDMPVRSVRFPCNGHGEAESRPVPTHSRARWWGLFCMRHVKPMIVGRVEAGGGGHRRVTTMTAEADRSVVVTVRGGQRVRTRSADG